MESAFLENIIRKIGHLEMTDPENGKMEPGNFQSDARCFFFAIAFAGLAINRLILYILTTIFLF